MLLSGFAIPVLPFQLHHALLPGESLKLDADEHSDLFDAIERQPVAGSAAVPMEGIFGQVLRGENGPSQVYPMLPLLRLSHEERQDGIWATVKCIGRTRLLRFKEEATTPVVTAWVAPFADAERTAATAAEVPQIEELHLSVAQLFHGCAELRSRRDKSGLAPSRSEVRGRDAV